MAREKISTIAVTVEVYPTYDFLLRQPNVIAEFSVVISRPDVEESYIHICVNKTVDDGGGKNMMSLSTSLGHVTDSTYPVKYHR